ncbi:MAG: alpha/beta hydrolase [Elainella sp.]
MPLLLKFLLPCLGVAAAVYLAICVLLYAQQARMIFFPARQVETTPAAFGTDYEEVWIPVGQQGERLHGWWIPAAQPNPNQPVLLYLHGNAVNIGANAEHANRFHRIGMTVLIIDYRGYGQSDGGFPNEQQVYEDAEASWRYLTQTRQIPPQQIFIYGHSLGGAIGIELASRHPDAAGLIVQGSFTSIRQMIDYQTPRSIFPTDLILHQFFDSIRKVPYLQLPLLYIHGLDDNKVPARMTQALYAASPEPKQIYLVPAAGHNDVAQVAGPEYLQVVQQFVQQQAAQKLR